MRIGDGMDPKTEMGPSVDENQFKTVLEYLNIGREDGATLVCGGERATGDGLDKGYFVRPTVFDHVRSEEHTSELQSQSNLVCRLLLEKKKQQPSTVPSRSNAQHDTTSGL